MTDKNIDRPQKIKNSEAELEVLAKLRQSLEWAILKRVMNRYVDNLRKAAFKMDESDPHFAVIHARYAGEALGLKKLVRLVEKSEERLDEAEQKEDS